MKIKLYQLYGETYSDEPVWVEFHELNNGDWCKYEYIVDLETRISVAVKILEQPGRFDDLHRALTMPIESLYEFIKNNPQYGEK